MNDCEGATTKALTRYGEMRVFVHDPIASQSLVKYGEWAQNELNVLAQFIRPGAIVVDGGGYVGSHTLAFSHFVGDQGMVHTFEPSAVSYEVLSANVRDNRCANVVLHPQGLAAAATDLVMTPLDFEQGANFGGASFHTQEDSVESETPVSLGNRAHFVPLDDVLSHADFLKLDLEGMEGEALRGADRILILDRPHVFAECNCIANGAALLAAMRPRGYRAFGCLVRAFNPNNFRGVAENMFGEAMEFGLLFVHDSKLDEAATAIGDCGLLEVADEDALAAYLFRKPQYPGEVLRQTPQWGALDLQARFRLVALFDTNVESGSAKYAQARAQGSYDGLPLEERALARIDKLQAALEEAQSLAFERQQDIDRLQSALEAMQALALERKQGEDRLQFALQDTQNLAHARYNEIEVLAKQRNEARASEAAARASVKECLRRIDALGVTLSDVQALAAERTAQRDRARMDSRNPQSVVSGVSR